MTEKKHTPDSYKRVWLSMEIDSLKSKRKSLVDRLSVIEKRIESKTSQLKKLNSKP